MSGNNSDKNNNQKIDNKQGNMTINSDTNNNLMTHDHEAFIHQIKAIFRINHSGIKVH